MRRRRDRLLKRKNRMLGMLIAHDLKRSQEQRKEDQIRQAENQRRNDRMREQIGGLLGITPDRVRPLDLQKMILWEELHRVNVADRRCPYSGVQISASMLFSDQVEIEHILRWPALV